jgi:nicotinamidase-related amidase
LQKPWPYNGVLHPSQTALIVIDMQRDFLDPTGYIGSMGYDVSVTRRTIEPTKIVLDRFRELGASVVIETSSFFS